MARMTYNPLSGQFDYYELDISPSGDVEFLKGDAGTSVGPDAATKAITLEGGTGIDVVENVGGNKLTIQLKGGITGTGSTVGAVTADLITLDLGAVPSSYLLKVDVMGFESTTPAACSYRLRGGFRTTGAATTELGTDIGNTFEEAALAAAKVELIASGNNVIVRSTGIIGLTVSWTATLTFSIGV